jgi:N-acetylmuramoyl-L-alanine amidase
LSEPARPADAEPAELRSGSSGEAVRDLQRRLAALGHPVPPDEFGAFGDATAAAVRAFQDGRGLRADGVCGRETWSALVESGFDLGDRLLYRRRPMLRGDDVHELQRRLNALGFDAGREDGILGDDTGAALTDFQRNAGITADGICGPETIAALRRLGTLAEGSVASVRERESLRRGPHTLAGRRVFVAAAPGFEAVATGIVHGLLESGADAVLDTYGDNRSEIAAAANHYDADLFVALAPGDAPGCRCSFFESGRFRSEAGFRVAHAIFEELDAQFHLGGGVCGRTYAVLRETRMAAVICEPGPATDTGAVAALAVGGHELAEAVIRGIRRGVGIPANESR